MGNERFFVQFFRFSTGSESFFCLDLDPYRYDWIRIRTQFFRILDPDSYHNDTDPQHCLPVFIILASNQHKVHKK